MAKGYYKPGDIRKDGLLKLKKLKERDAIAKPRAQCAWHGVQDHYDVYERQCGNYAKRGKRYCHVHESLEALSKGTQP